MVRRLVDAPPVLGEKNNPVRLFAGSGLRPDTWRDLLARFGPAGVLELYASTEANTILANASGKKIGSVGRPLPGSPEVVIAAWDFAKNEFERDGAGHLVHALLDEPGMLVARLSSRAGADVAHIDPHRLLRDAFEPGDLWFVTGDAFQVDVEGDYWFVDHANQMIETRNGPVASRRIEDALYEVPNIELCVATGRPSPDDPTLAIPIAAVQLHGASTIDLTSLSAAVATLPEYARPRRLRVVDSIPLTDGYRPIKHALRELDLDDGPGVYAWDPRSQRYVATESAEHPPARAAR